jgi:NAD+ synthase
LSSDPLAIDTEVEIQQICDGISTQVLGVLRRRGAVVAVSGGIDSSVVAALCARALGPDRVFALLMPERASSEAATRLGQQLVDSLGVASHVEHLAPSLEAIGCYEAQDRAIRTLVPEYGPDWSMKLVLPPLLERDRLSVTRLVVQPPGGQPRTVRPTPETYRQLVAATNYKQRLRKVKEYYHADRLHYAVAGTPNRLEYDQGFFVKQGDGAADFKPIAHLYKTQVYALAEALRLPEEIRSRPPTTDTFSMEQSQEEFYFGLPYGQMDLCLYAFEHDLSKAEAGELAGLSEEQVERVYRDIQAKRRTTRYLHLPPLLIGEDAEA